jgi:hypothetical protein
MLMMEHIVTYSLRIELLDGYKRSFDVSERFECGKQWHLPLSVWERFNASCTQLKEFNWVVVPFADSFFSFFGQYTKPQLTALSFGISMRWDWAGYFEACGEDVVSCIDGDGNCTMADFGSKASYVSSALKGCPGLKRLEFAVYHPLDESTPVKWSSKKSLAPCSVPTTVYKSQSTRC